MQGLPDDLVELIAETMLRDNVALSVLLMLSTLCTAVRKTIWPRLRDAWNTFSTVHQVTLELVGPVGAVGSANGFQWDYYGQKWFRSDLNVVRNRLMEAPAALWQPEIRMRVAQLRTGIPRTLIPTLHQIFELACGHKPTNRLTWVGLVGRPYCETKPDTTYH